MSTMIGATIEYELNRKSYQSKIIDKILMADPCYKGKPSITGYLVLVVGEITVHTVLATDVLKIIKF